MAKKHYNLNRRKSTNIILLILALSFLAVPIITLIIYSIAVANVPWM